MIFNSEVIEKLARIIDPEAFGLPNNAEPCTLTDRDQARDRARLILAEIGSADCPSEPSPYPPGDTISIAKDGPGATATVEIARGGIVDLHGRPVVSTKDHS